MMPASISVLEGLEAVRKRPGMYIGSVSRKGLNHLIYEIVDNAVDEHLAGLLRPDPGVPGKGRFLPQSATMAGASRWVCMKRECLQSVWYLPHFMQAVKFDDSVYKTSGGLHGVGSSVVNALSAYLDVKISRDGYIHHDRYERGIPTIELENGLLPTLGKTKETGTEINFLPDPRDF